VLENNREDLLAYNILSTDVSLHLRNINMVITGFSCINLLQQSDLNIVASFDRRGQYVYTGNAKGKVLVLSTSELALKASFKVTQGTTSATAVKSIEFARRGE
jgi:hypothetical protein